MAMNVPHKATERDEVNSVEIQIHPPFLVSKQKRESQYRRIPQLRA